MDSNVVAPRNLIPPELKWAIQRRVFAISLNRPVESMTRDELTELRQSRLVIMVMYGPRGMDACTVMNEHRDVVPIMRTSVPLSHLFFDAMDSDSILRLDRDREQALLLQENKPYEVLRKMQWTLRMEPPSFWGRHNVVEGIVMRPGDKNFFVQRMQRAEQLITDYVERTLEAEREQAQQLLTTMAEYYQEAMTMKDRQKEEEEEEEEEEETLEETVHLSLQEVQRQGITAHLRQVMNATNELPPEDERRAIMDELSTIWAQEEQESQSLDKGKEQHHQQQRTYHTLSHPVAIIELDFVATPPHILNRSGAIGEMRSAFQLFSRCITPVHFDTNNLQVAVKTDMFTDAELIKYLQKSALITVSSEGEQHIGPAGEKYLRGMTPVVTQGPARYFGIRRGQDVWTHHITMSFYVCPRDPGAACVNELQFTLQIADKRLGMGTAVVTVPWRRIALQAGVMDADQNGMAVNVESMKSDRMLSYEPETSVSRCMFNQHEEWTVTATGIPYMCALPMVIQPVVSKQHIIKRAVDALAPPDEQQQQQEAGGSVSEKPDLLTERSRLITFHGLYVCIHLSPNIITTVDPIRTREDILVSSIELHRYSDFPLATHGSASCGPAPLNTK